MCTLTNFQIETRSRLHCVHEKTLLIVLWQKGLIVLVRLLRMYPAQCMFCPDLLINNITQLRQQVVKFSLVPYFGTFVIQEDSHTIFSFRARFLRERNYDVTSGRKWEHPNNISFRTNTGWRHLAGVDEITHL